MNLEKYYKTSDLSKVQVGDWIFTIQSGWQKVIKINNSKNVIYSIKLSDHKTYTINGKYDEYDKYPTAWTFNPFDLKDLPVKFISGEVIMVRDSHDGIWLPDIFNSYHPEQNYLYSCAQGQWKYARKLNNTELGQESE